ncbi:hypothetical protein GCM10022267_91460 [Lentzea roselyniae]|uniref:Uncharacterized protein n=1 Tax=Lentzea roselyniae TaxID=531940 RepID=A0ABP7CHS3_9PSEU
MDAYIAALNNKDSATLERISPSNVRPDFAGHVAEKGGKSITVESVDITKDFGPDVASAHVIGRAADEQRYDERLVLSRIDGRWFVTIGPATPNKPGSEVSRTP